MAIDWDADVLGAVMSVFGEGDRSVPASLPTYTPKGGRAFQLADAVYDEQYTRVIQEGEGSEVSTTGPVIGVREAVFRAAGQPQPQQGDRVFVPSKDQLYLVQDVQPDSHGHVLLILIEARA
ncbi:MULTISPECIES: head-tail joining protein [Sphingomonas]|uniref:head-tail joining protein n=1 Tax=Sphingomonas TaxID=13687 RepID=UPI00254E5A0A|nr:MULTISPECIES: hypothetical protein [Sphingomonas]MDK8187773.1 hypothetical protein [Sphingomonas zeae]MDK8217627.1 hypothetical protein [Sphingomonas sp. UMB7805-LC452B]